MSYPPLLKRAYHGPSIGNIRKNFSLFSKNVRLSEALTLTIDEGDRRKRKF
jgi:hypothetical protein